MNRIITASTVAFVLTGALASPASAQDKKDVVDPKIGTMVTITGCLHQGEARDSFMLLGVTERPAGTKGPSLIVPIAIYSLDSTDGLKELVGEFVDVTGKITDRRSGLGKVTVSLDPSEHKDKDVEVNTSGRNVTTEKFDSGSTPAGSSRTSASALEVMRPVYKLKVNDVRAVNYPVPGPPCR